MRIPRRSHRSQRAAARRRLLKLEPLEVRNLLAVFTVDDFTDLDPMNPTLGTLRSAIELANAQPDLDVIQFSASGSPIMLTQELNVTQPLTIIGGDGITISGNGQSRVFNFGGAGANTYTLSRLVITGGNAVGAINSGFGGAIHMDDVDDTLAIDHAQVIINTAMTTLSDGAAGGIYVGGGSLFLTDSVVANNTADFFGGVVVEDANGTLNNVTVSSNTDLQAPSGALYMNTTAGSHTLDVRNSTVAFNNSGGANFITDGGAATFTVGNSIFSNNGGINFDASGAVLTNFVSLGHNLSDDASGLLTGTGDQPIVDPMLDNTLQDNGGGTLTHALMAGSTAINPPVESGYTAIATPVDQRGRLRDSTPDIGAFEFGVVAPPLVTVSIGDAMTLEGDGPNPVMLAFPVSLNAPTDADVTVLVTTADGSALAGTDYDALTNQMVTIPAGDTMATAVVNVSGDVLVEADETFTATLSDVRFDGATVASRATLGAMATATGTIDNDDTATLLISDAMASEADGFMEFEISLSHQVDIAIDVQASYAGGNATGSPNGVAADYDNDSDMVMFSALDTAPKMVTVAITDDNLVEAMESFLASLTVVTAPLGGRTVDTSDTGTGTITDNDTATLTINDVTVNEGAGTATFTVALSRALDIAIDVDVSYANDTADAADYDDTTDTVMFAAGSTTDQMVTVAINDDNLVEATESFLTSLTVITALDGRTVDTSDIGTGTITDNDTAALTINDVTVNEGAGTATFTVSLSNPFDITVDADVSYADASATAGSDYDDTPDGVMFAAGSNVDQIVTVAITDDNLVEATESFLASLTVITAVGGRSVDTSDTGTGTINDNDTATFTIDDVTVNEGAGTATFTVSLSNPFDITVDADVSYADASATAGSDYDDTPDGVMFAAGSNVDQIVTVAITDDNLVEATESFLASLTVITAVGGRSVDTSDTGTGSITDNDTATFTINDQTVNETTGIMTFSVSISNPVDIPVTVDVSYFDVSATGTAGGLGGDYDNTADQVTFAALDTAPKTVSVALTLDNTVEPDETFDATLNTASPLGTRLTNFIDTGIGTIIDNDAATLSITAPTITESNSNQTVPFIVRLTGAVQGGFSVPYTTTLGTASSSDVMVPGNLLNFAGTRDETQVINAIIVGDTLVEGNETFTISLGTPSVARVTSGAPALATINNDDRRISGIKWSDLNGNGIRDPGEPGLAGVTIYLDTNNNGVLDGGERSAVTNAGGAYVFDNPPLGANTIREVSQAGWEQTFPRKRFDTSESLATATISGFVDAVDLDNAGLRDLVVVNDYRDTLSFQASVTLLVNAGAAGFQSTEVAMPDHSRPQAVHVGDLNGDGRPDLAVASAGERSNPQPNTNGVLIYLNDGNGGYPALSEFLPTGDGPSDIVGLDLNEDGITDLVTTNHRSGNISILLGKPGGGFDPAIHRSVGDTPAAVTVGLLDGDGHLDLVVANFAGNSLSVFFGTGAADLLEPPITINGVDGPMDVVLADIDGDRITDLATVELRTNSAVVFAGTENRTFGAPTRFEVGGAPTSLAAGDVNADGNVDLVVGNAGESAATLLINLGAGVLGTSLDSGLPTIPTINPALAPSPYGVSLADLDGDRDLDLAVAHFVGGVSVHTNLLGAHPVNVVVGSVTQANFGNISVGAPLLVDRQVAAQSNGTGADVNLDGVVSPADVRMVINYLNRGAEAEFKVALHLDVNQDEHVTPADALLVINRVNATVRSLTAEQLDSVAATAVDLWAAAGLDLALVQRLRNVEFRVADVAGDMLAVSVDGRIHLDGNAAGYGWFIDASPTENHEFVAGEHGLRASRASSVEPHVDLLTAVLHEQGHLLGLPHGELDELMSARLARGVRRLPSARDAALAEWF